MRSRRRGVVVEEVYPDSGADGHDGGNYARTCAFGLEEVEQSVDEHDDYGERPDIESYARPAGAFGCSEYFGEFGECHFRFWWNTIQKNMTTVNTSSRATMRLSWFGLV